MVKILVSVMCCHPLHRLRHRGTKVRFSVEQFHHNWGTIRVYRIRQRSTPAHVRGGSVTSVTLKICSWLKSRKRSTASRHSRFSQIRNHRRSCAIHPISVTSVILLTNPATDPSILTAREADSLKFIIIALDSKPFHRTNDRL